MITKNLFAAFMALRSAQAYLVTPSGTAFPGANSDCSEWVSGASGLTCAEVFEQYDINQALFYYFNPYVLQVSDTCELLSSYYYCVNINYLPWTEYSWTTPKVSSSSMKHVVSSSSLIPSVHAMATGSATPTPTTLISSHAISTPSPIQTGMTSTCDEFYLVVSGDTCAAIASSYSISLDDFYAWNPAVGSSCANLWVDDYVCVDTVASKSTASVATSSSDQVSTPYPIQTGMTSTCDEFYLVVSGDTCATIASSYSISLDDFYAWNPAVGSSCANLWVDDYVCVAVQSS
ncbi:hypothetical protein N7451_006067 [Penicillium sp. IBT 35674x]|nr:hypothetical protein N7451_006067 [Penicillium sp. IBT 35674x]